MAPHIVHAKFSLKLLPPSISHICRCIALYTVLISQTCQRDSQPFFVAGKKLSETRRVVKNGSWQTAAAREGGEERERGEREREREWEKEGATGNGNTWTRKGRRLRVGLATRPLLRAAFLIPRGVIRVPFPFNEFLVAFSTVVRQDHCSCRRRFSIRKSGCTGCSALRCTQWGLEMHYRVHFHALRNAIVWIIGQ